MYAETVIVDKRESKSRPGEGIVTLAHTARNQHGDIVATAVRKTMVRKQAGRAAATAALDSARPGLARSARPTGRSGTRRPRPPRTW